MLDIAEHRDGNVLDVSYELISAGRELADANGGDLHLAIIGGDVDSFADDLSLEGVDTIHTVDEGDEFNHDIYEQVAAQLYAEIDPDHLLMPHSVNGWDYAPAVANELDLPLVTDVIGFELNGDFQVIREMYGSKVETFFTINADHTAITVRPGEFNATEAAGSPAVESFDATIDDSDVGSEVHGFETADAGDVDISEAEFLVSIGRGIEEEDNLEIMEELSEVSGATLSASRPITDNGWLPKNRQVGQSGKVVTPKLYIAFGISGAVQHVAGMKGSETILAVNTDPDAPIFDLADYGVVEDLFDVVPALTDRFQEA
ncbi:MAG: electron transfer flavoprotein subunit alpha/FixB family protein [bacterium]